MVLVVLFWLFTLVADVSPRWGVCLKRGCITTKPGLRPPQPLLSGLSLFPQIGSRVFAGARRCAVWWLDELYYKKAMMEGAGGAHSPLRVVLLSFVWTHVHP